MIQWCWRSRAVWYCPMEYCNSSILWLNSKYHLIPNIRVVTPIVKENCLSKIIICPVFIQVNQEGILVLFWCAIKMDLCRIMTTNIITTHIIRIKIIFFRRIFYYGLYIFPQRGLSHSLSIKGQNPWHIVSTIWCGGSLA